MKKINKVRLALNLYIDPKITERIEEIVKKDSYIYNKSHFGLLAIKLFLSEYEKNKQIEEGK